MIRLTYQTDLSRATYDRHVEVVEGQGRLKKRLLLADEMGAITSRTIEILQGNTWVKKVFVLNHGEAEAAELVVRMDRPGRKPDEVAGEQIMVEVNGRWIEHRSQVENISFQGPVDAYWSTGWEVIPIPVEALKAGANTFILRDGSGQGWTLYVDNTRLRDRSFKSCDGGQSWSNERLGHNDFCVGEYVIRLNLKRYAPAGVITSPPIDLAAGDKGPVALQMNIQRVHLALDRVMPEGTTIDLDWRSGPTPSYQPATWSAWAAVTGPFTPSEGHRFLQWRATLGTSRVTATPVLQGVTLTLEGDLVEPVNPALRVVESENPELVRASHRFAYQLADEPRLQMLRERWRLDHVVAGARTEFDRILRLKRWVRQQWEDGWNRGTLQFVPPWDAPLVLELAGQQLALGMCTHYASTFVQCCLALGLEARVCIISSHCVAEVWSNEWQKWVMMDPGCDADDGRKGTRYFERHGIPMSALDLHLAYVKDDFNGVVEHNDPEQFGGTIRENASLYRQFCTTLRNNFITSLYPEEPEHGAISYTYDGHLWYQSDAMPLPQFSTTSRRRGDFGWTLNATQIYLQQGAQPDQLAVQLDTVMPNFQTYLVRFDSGEWQEQEERFPWLLTGARSELVVKARNRFGVDGPPGRIVVARE